MGNDFKGLDEHAHENRMRHYREHPGERVVLYHEGGVVKEIFCKDDADACVRLEEVLGRGRVATACEIPNDIIDMNFPRVPPITEETKKSLVGQYGFLIGMHHH